MIEPQARRPSPTPPTGRARPCRGRDRLVRLLAPDLGVPWTCAEALAWLDEPRQPRDATAGPGRRRALARPHARASSTCSATRSTSYPVIHVTGTNGKGSTARMITRAAGRARACTVGTYTSPHLAAAQRAHQPATASRSPTTSWPSVLTDLARLEPLAGVEPTLVRAAHRGRLPLVRRRRRRRRRRRGRAARPLRRHQRRRRRGRGGHQRRPRPHRLRRATGAGRSPRRRRASSSRARPSCSARPTRRCAPIFDRRRRRRGAGSADEDFGCDDEPARRRRAAARPAHARTARSTRCSCRCTAPTRATTPPWRSPRPRRSSAAPLDADVVRDAFGRRRVPGRFEVVGRDAAGRARRRPQRRPAPRPRPQTLARRLRPRGRDASSSSACSRPRDPAPMLEALERRQRPPRRSRCTPDVAAGRAGRRGRRRRPRRLGVRRRGRARRRPRPCDRARSRAAGRRRRRPRRPARSTSSAPPATSHLASPSRRCQPSPSAAHEPDLRHLQARRRRARPRRRDRRPPRAQGPPLVAGRAAHRRPRPLAEAPLRRARRQAVLRRAGRRSSPGRRSFAMVVEGPPTTPSRSCAR